MLLATTTEGGNTFKRGGQMKSILDPSFRYTTSVETDLRKTFARIRRERRKQQEQQSVARVELMRKVLRIHSS
jgi:hypothetical protein